MGQSLLPGVLAGAVPVTAAAAAAFVAAAALPVAAAAVAKPAADWLGTDCQLGFPCQHAVGG